jgi:ribonuclease HI
VELLAVVARKLWLRRNSLVFEGIFRHPNEVLEEAIVALEDFRRCNDLETQKAKLPVVANNSGLDRWSPPSFGEFKVNWDASINSKDKCIGIGIVVRDSLGEVVGARCILQKIDLDPKAAESMAALKAVLFCKEVGFSQVIFEGDASQVILDINSPPPHFSKAGHLTESVIKELRSFRKATFVHVPRELNEVAHTLAKEAAVRKVDNCWLEEVPVCISSLVVREKSLIPRSPLLGS